MKKREFTIFILLLFLINFAYAQSYITGNTVLTGEATKSFSVSVNIVSSNPSILFFSPKNVTYISNQSIPINFISSNTQAIWFNLNNFQNLSLTQNMHINLPEGTHTMYVFANNSQGNLTSWNVTFTINNSFFVIKYGNFSNNASGVSFNLSGKNYEELQNISDFKLENRNYARISFNSIINLTDDWNNTDNIMDIDSYVNISWNRIEINSTNAPNLNKSATLILYNLSFTNPKILKDGEECSSSICSINQYSNGNISFNVTHFSVYSIDEETSSLSPGSGSSGSSGSSGGSSSTGIAQSSIIEIDTSRILISLKQGEIKSQDIKIKNIGTTKVNLTMASEYISELIRLSESNFEVSPGESKIIKIDFIAQEDKVPELYIGKIIVKGNGINKEIFTGIEIESYKALFDVSVEIPKKFLNVLAGEDLIFGVKIFNLGRLGKVDIALDYELRDSNNNVIVSDHETNAIETQASFLKSIKVPEGLTDGNYIMYVKVSYDNQVASAAGWFSIGEENNFLNNNIYPYIIVISILFILLLAIIVIFYQKRLLTYRDYNESDKRRLRKWKK